MAKLCSTTLTSAARSQASSTSPVRSQATASAQSSSVRSHATSSTQNSSVRSPASTTSEERRIVALDDLLRPRPIPNSYWATESALACEYPWSPRECFGQQKLNDVLRAGVRSFLDLTEANELSPYELHLMDHARALGIDESSIEYHRFPIVDCGVPDIELVHRVLTTLQDNVRRGRVSAIHCRGGIGRTGLIVGCWLVASKGFTGEEALAVIARGWQGVAKRVIYPHSPQTPAQFAYVREFTPEKEQLAF